MSFIPVNSLPGWILPPARQSHENNVDLVPEAPPYKSFVTEYLCIRQDLPSHRAVLDSLRNHPLLLPARLNKTHRAQKKKIWTGRARNWPPRRNAPRATRAVAPAVATTSERGETGLHFEEPTFNGKEGSSPTSLASPAHPLHGPHRNDEYSQSSHYTEMLDDELLDVFEHADSSVSPSYPIMATEVQVSSDHETDYDDIFGDTSSIFDTLELCGDRSLVLYETSPPSTKPTLDPGQSDQPPSSHNSIVTSEAEIDFPTTASEDMFANLHTMIGTLTSTADDHVRPVQRTPFPESLITIAPPAVVGLSSGCIRTCFRIGEAINCAGQMHSSGGTAMIELFARVLKVTCTSEHPYDQRTSVMHLRDMYHDRPPHLEAYYRPTSSLQRRDLARLSTFDQTESGKLCRCVGYMVRGEGHRWILTAFSVWEASSADVEFVAAIFAPRSENESI